MNVKRFLSLLCAGALLLCAGCAADPAPASSGEPTPTEPTQPGPDWSMFETYTFLEEQTKPSHWASAFKQYMFPQGDGTMQFGMGVNELYCLGAFNDNADIYNKLMVVDMLLGLQPQATWLLRAKLLSGMGPTNPCYAIAFNDSGTDITVDFVKYGEDGQIEKYFLRGASLGGIIDPYEYNRYEAGLINQDDGSVRLLLRINGTVLLDTADTEPSADNLNMGYMLFQGAYSTVQLRGLDSKAATTSEKPVKVGEYDGIPLYDVSALSMVTTRIMATITTPLEYKADNGITVKYRLYLPTHYDPTKQYPLYLHLHGGGARGTDNMTQIMHDFNQIYEMVRHQSDEEFIFVIPECMPDRFWADSMTFSGGEYHVNITEDNEGKQMQALLELLGKLCDKYSVNQKRLYLGGASMGGMGSYDVLIRHPGLFASAWVGCAANDLSKVSELAKTPVYILHGEIDTTVPTHWSRDTAAALEQLGAEFVYNEVKGHDHDFTTQENMEAAMTWVFSHTLP